MTNHDEQMKAVARLVSGRPDWIDAPAVQAWHRSDGRTEHDGTPGKPRIWSPDYRTTERWSTPSLQNVHWSDLVDVTPLAPVRECPDPEQHGPVDYKVLLEQAERERDRWHRAALTMQTERDEARARLAEAAAEIRAQGEAIAELAAEPRPLTPDAITDEMVERAVNAYATRRWNDGAVGCLSHKHNDAMREALTLALTEPPARPEGAEELGELIGEYLDSTPGVDDKSMADFLAERGVRVVTEEQP